MGVYVAPHRPTPRPWKLPTTEDEWQVELKLLGARIAEVLLGIATGFDKRTPGWQAVGADIVCPHYDRTPDDRRVSAQYLNMDIHFCKMCFDALKMTCPELGPEASNPELWSQVITRDCL